MIPPSVDEIIQPPGDDDEPVEFARAALAERLHTVAPPAPMEPLPPPYPPGVPVDPAKPPQMPIGRIDTEKQWPSDVSPEQVEP